jgi:membrane protease YdiL (CAAX protease family)
MIETPAFQETRNRHERAPLNDRLRGFGPLGVSSIVLILLTGNLVGTALTVIWTQLSRTPWSALGFIRTRHWLLEVTTAALSGAVFRVLMKAVVMPALGFPAVNQTWHFLAGNSAALPTALATMIFGAGLGEETIWRGFLFERARTLLGTSRLALAVTLVLTSLLFGSAHLLDQGWPGATQATITGFAFGLAYLRLGRIWPVVVAHAAFDVTAVVMIYLNLEEAIAHALLR